MTQLGSLVPPSTLARSAFERLQRDVLHAEDDFASVRSVDLAQFDAYIARLHGLSNGSIATKSGVPLSTFWYVDSLGEILAISALRHALTPALLDYGGHIGFAVRPSARRRGVATRTLESTLLRAASLGIPRVRLTCDASNVGSRAVIERCGGALDDESISEQSPTRALVRRYWIALT